MKRAVSDGLTIVNDLTNASTDATAAGTSGESRTERIAWRLQGVCVFLLSLILAVVGLGLAWALSLLLWTTVIAFVAVSFAILVPVFQFVFVCVCADFSEGWIQRLFRLPARSGWQFAWAVFGGLECYAVFAALRDAAMGAPAGYGFGTAVLDAFFGVVAVGSFWIALHLFVGARDRWLEYRWQMPFTGLEADLARMRKRMSRTLGPHPNFGAEQEAVLEDLPESPSVRFLESDETQTRVS